MKVRLLFLLAAVTVLAAFPAVAAANSVKPFSASGTVVRTAVGVAAIDAGTGGLLTTGQVFSGDLESGWKGLDGADITINQNSLIGIHPVALGTTGSSPLFGQAWGSFFIEDKSGSLRGAYAAQLSGTLYLDPFGATFGCQPTSLLGPIDVTGDGVPDPVGAFVEVTDSGTWQVTPETATGRMKRADEIGGMLLATAGGCLEGDETAELTLTGQLVPGGDKGDEDDDRGKRGDRDDDDDDDDRGKRGDRDGDGDDDRGKRGDRDGDDGDDRGKRGDRDGDGDDEVRESDGRGNRSERGARDR